MFEQIAKGAATSSKGKGTMIIGVDTLPQLPTDPGDRNRTSPFAFTGNRFEFRAPGSMQTVAGPMVMINTIMAEALDYCATELETAVAAGTGHGFATSGNDQSVVMFDLKTFKVLGRIPAAEDADAIIYDRASKRVFTFNGDAHSSTVIDPRVGTLITNIPLGGKPEYGASAASAPFCGALPPSARL